MTPYRTSGHNGIHWFVDSDGDIIRLDCIEGSRPRHKEGSEYTVSLLMKSGEWLHVKEGDFELIKKELGL